MLNCRILLEFYWQQKVSCSEPFAMYNIRKSTRVQRGSTANRRTLTSGYLTRASQKQRDQFTSPSKKWQVKVYDCFDLIDDQEALNKDKKGREKKETIKNSEIKKVEEERNQVSENSIVEDKKLQEKMEDNHHEDDGWGISSVDEAFISNQKAHQATTTDWDDVPIMEEDTEPLPDYGERREDEDSLIRPSYEFNTATQRMEVRSPSPPLSVPPGYRLPWLDPLTPMPEVTDENEYLVREISIREYHRDQLDLYQRLRVNRRQQKASKQNWLKKQQAKQI